MTKQDRERALALLAESATALHTAIEAVHDSQWRWKPAPDRWSIGETVEHIVIVEPFLFSRIQSAISAGAVEDAAERTAGKAELLERIMVGRQTRVPAPPPVVPKGELRRSELLARFATQRSVFADWIQTTEEDLHRYTAEHRFATFGTLSAYQWLLNISFHTLRHCKQIDEIKATEGYPE